MPSTHFMIRPAPSIAFAVGNDLRCAFLAVVHLQQAPLSMPTLSASCV
jgi:hypothetical protein